MNKRVHSSVEEQLTSPPPRLEGLEQQIRFAPDTGRIWLNNKRMVLLHGSGLGVLRRELIESLGIESARGLITRIGYNSGVNDGDLARTLRQGEDAAEALSIGPQLHMLEGMVRVEPVRMEADEETGSFYGEFLWHGSIEAEEHLRSYGVTRGNSCWMQTGYASGFVSTFMGRPVLFREVECRACGDTHCRIVGKPADEWEDAHEDLQYLRADDFTSGLSRTARTHTPDSDQGVASGRQTNSLGDIEVVGASAGFNAVCHMVRRVADTEATVLFLGESGVGKEVLARGLHAISNRRDHPFVAVNCAAIPDNLVEAELFGVQKGAFTGAQSTRPGRFERADGGTLFLDEIGILSWTAQGKLLRALQEREIERVGDTRVRRVDVRVLAATNLDLKKEVKAGRFREDLYYRLNVFPVRVPPLRERPEDIPIFMNHFLAKYNARNGRSVRGFSSRAINALLTYDYPGNIRELENMIERGCILAHDGGSIDSAHLFAAGDPNTDETRLSRAEEPEPDDSDEVIANDPELDRIIHGTKALISGERDAEKPSLDQLQLWLLEAAVSRAEGNLSAAARQLGITRAQLAYRLDHKR